LYSTDLRETNGELTLLLLGEFDVSALEDLRDVLDYAGTLRDPVAVDLAGVTFLDLGTARELAVRCQVYAHRLKLRSPSWQVRASVRACGLEEWLTFDPDDRGQHPRIVSKAS
jgi:anti-anti-sigma regulatory factor